MLVPVTLELSHAIQKSCIGREHVLPLYDLTMLNSTVSSVQHQITLR